MNDLVFDKVVSKFNLSKTNPNGVTYDSPGHRPGSNEQKYHKP
jgi:hypothetical protein